MMAGILSRAVKEGRVLVIRSYDRANHDSCPGTPLVLPLQRQRTGKVRDWSAWFRVGAELNMMEGCCQRAVKEGRVLVIRSYDRANHDGCQVRQRVSLFSERTWAAGQGVYPCGKGAGPCVTKLSH